MIIKGSPWTTEKFETSVHPEYAAIRNLVQKFPFGFILVGVGGRAYHRFKHPTLDIVFLNVPSGNLLLRLMVYPMLFMLVVLTRPRVIVTMGIFIQIPVQFAAELVSARHLATLIGEPFYGSTRTRTLRGVALILLKVALKRTDSIIAVSQKMKQDALRIIGGGFTSIDVYRYRLPRIFKPAPPKEPSNSDRERIVLTSCRIDRRKGLELVISAASSVLRASSRVKFIIRGPISDITYFNELRAMIRMKGLATQVRLIGEECRYEELPKVFSKADIFVHPSLDESLGLAIAESLACGIPVVATRVGGIPELVEHEVNGLLVDPSPDCIATAIMRVFTDKRLRSRLKRGAREFSKNIRKPSDTDFDQVLEIRIRKLL
jgi:glycosyltransferase involved in cell wall biosynthesis